MKPFMTRRRFLLTTGVVLLGSALQGDGHLWLQNSNNAVLHLRTAREGLMLTLGASGVVISVD